MRKKNYHVLATFLLLLIPCLSQATKNTQDTYPFPAFDPLTVSPTPKIVTGCEPPRLDATIKQTIKPEYPEKSIRRGIAGYVIFDFRINGDGRVENAELVAETPAGAFEKHSLNALKKFRFSVENRDSACLNQMYRVAYSYHYMTQCIPNIFPPDVTHICVTGHIQRLN